MTIREFLPQYMEHKLKTVKLSSVSTYSLNIRKNLLPCLGDYNLEDITNKEAEKLKSFCERKGLSRKTTGDVIICLKNILKVASLLGVAETQQISVIWGTMNNEIVPKLEVYNKAHLHKFTEYLEENPSFANLGLLLTIYTGMRIGEVCGLQWAHVDLDEKIIHVRQTIQRVYIEDPATGKTYTEIIINSPKTMASNRDVPIVPKLYKLMKDFSKVCKPNYFVCTGSAKPTEPRTYRNLYKRITDELGLPRLKFHGLRHTFATQMLSAKSDIKTLSSILGHSNVSTTMNVYLHPSLDDKRNAMAKLKF